MTTKKQTAPEAMGAAAEPARALSKGRADEPLGNLDTLAHEARALAHVCRQADAKHDVGVICDIDGEGSANALPRAGVVRVLRQHGAFKVARELERPAPLGMMHVVWFTDDGACLTLVDPVAVKRAATCADILASSDAGAS